MAKVEKITEEEAVIMRDEEVKDFYQSKIMVDAKGKAKTGVNGKPLLQDTMRKVDGKTVGFQITLND